MNQGSNFFVAGGTLPPNSRSYVKREADQVLFRQILDRKFCYVLTARQIGKSSLMRRTALRLLDEEKIHSVDIDLNLFGTASVTVDQWYLGLLAKINKKLQLGIDPETWWLERNRLAIVDRFTTFLREVVQQSAENRVVIFIDEIDSTQSLAFSADDFFRAIRAVHNSPEFDRLVFVLLGVATPDDLIEDRTGTPFDIGQRVDLHEFTRSEARILEDGLEFVCPGQGDRILDDIFFWTNGHPYLTQRLCLAVANSGTTDWPSERVNVLVEQLLLSKRTSPDTNLRYVADNIVKSPQAESLLHLYRQVYLGHNVHDVQSPEQNRLKLLGLLRVEGNKLEVNNNIYHRVFSWDWIEGSLAEAKKRRMSQLELDHPRRTDKVTTVPNVLEVPSRVTIATEPPIVETIPAPESETSQEPVTKSKRIPYIVLIMLALVAVGVAVIVFGGLFSSQPPVVSSPTLIVATNLTEMPDQSAALLVVDSTSTPTPTTTPTLTPTNTSIPPTATSSPSPTPTATNTTLPTPTSTPTSTDTPTTTPTAVPPTPVIVEVSPTAPPSPTPISGEFVLLEPASLEIPTHGDTEFKWRWNGLLLENQGFEVRVWRDGEPQTGVHDAVSDNKEGGKIESLGDNTYRLVADMTEYQTDSGTIQRESGEYNWTVLLIQIDPYQELGIQADPPGHLRFELLGGGGDGGGGDGGGGSSGVGVIH